MATIEMTVDTFPDLIRKEGIIFIDFWATWCPPCRTFSPIFEAASALHRDITFAKVDTDAQSDLAEALEIRSIPTLMVFRDGVLLFAEAGVLPLPALDQLVSKVRALDMSEVRRKLAESRVA